MFEVQSPKARGVWAPFASQGRTSAELLLGGTQRDVIIGCMLFVRLYCAMLNAPVPLAPPV